MSTRNQSVLSPIEIAGRTLKNRVVSTAHGTHFDLPGHVGKDLIAYHEARARGGVGLVILEIASVHPTSPAPINNYDEGIVEEYQALMDALSPHGLTVYQQLWHGGGHGLTPGGGAPWAPSAVPSVLTNTVGLAMTKGQIDEIIASFASAAERCKLGGLNGCEIHAGHGFLIQQFLSPLTNRRIDSYGGDLEGRSRFLVEIVQACRETVGEDFAIGIRLSEEGKEGGLTAEDNADIIRMLEAASKPDYFSLSKGGFFDFPAMIGAMHEGTGYMEDSVRPMLEAASIPTLVTGRYRTLDDADEVVRTGKGDLVGMTRALIADPELVRKSIEHEPDRVRPCIGCNQRCAGGVVSPRPSLGCTVNPDVGREREAFARKTKPAGSGRKVVIVGGGPAGMEAARTAALEGYRVTLMEAQPSLGGALTLARNAPWHHGIGDVADWLEREVYRLSVEVRTSTFADLDDIRNEGADTVIIATGGLPPEELVTARSPLGPVPVAAGSVVIDSRELHISPGSASQRRALITDDTGHYDAIAAADVLFEKGFAVDWITRFDSFSHMLQGALVSEPALRRFAQREFNFYPRHEVRRVTPDSATIGSIDGGPDREIIVGLVVANLNPVPNRELWHALQDDDISLFLVGDAQVNGFLPGAIAQGRAAALAIGRDRANSIEARYESYFQ